MARTPSPDDDAALRWDDFDDPTHADSTASSGIGDTASDDGASESASAGSSHKTAADGAVVSRSRVATLLTGLFAAIYLAYSVGWILSLGLVPLSGPTLLLEVLYQFSEFLAIIASALWFGTAVALTRAGSAAHRLGWLALGTLVLIPWPLLLAVTS